MATFNSTPNPCPFNWYAADPAFQTDADKVVTFVLRRLGVDFISVELTSKMIWEAFEEATMLLNANIIEYQAKSNLSTLLGTPTGSVDPNTGKYVEGSPNFTNTYVYPSFEFLYRQTEPYLASIGYGQSEESYSGSLTISMGKQDYDLSTELVDSYGVPLASYNLPGAQGKMRVFEVYHFGPSAYIFNSNVAATQGIAGIPMESYTTDTRYYLLPLFEDTLRGSMLQGAQNIRRSAYRFRISGKTLKIFPVPTKDSKLYIRVGFPGNPAPGILPPSGSVSTSGSYYLTSNGTPGQIIRDASSTFGASNPANIAAGLIDYKSLNPWARTWVFQYTLAICKEMVGLVRTKVKRFPIPGAELELNGDDLISQAKDEKEALLYGEHGLISKLDSLTYDKLAERDAQKAENLMKLMKYKPIPPTTIGWG